MAPDRDNRKASESDVGLDFILKSEAARRIAGAFKAQFDERDDKTRVQSLLEGAQRLMVVPPALAWLIKLNALPKQKLELIRKSGRLAREYKLPEAALTHLILELDRLKHLREPLTGAFDPNRLTSTDTSWKAAHATLKSLSKQLKRIQPLLRKISQDEVTCRALASLSSFYPVPDLVLSVLALGELTEQAAAIQGRKGRRRHPSWQSEASALCETFWQTHKPGKSSRGYFPKTNKRARGGNDTTEASNDYSRWFFDAMKAVDPAIKVNVCETLLRQRLP